MDKIVTYCLDHNNQIPTANSKVKETRSLAHWLTDRKKDYKGNTGRDINEGLKLAIEDKLTKFGFQWEVD